MRLRKVIFPIFFLLFIAKPFLALAYDDKTTHPALTQEIIEFYNLYFQENPITPEEAEWIIQGSILEDTPPRWINHFYDPINKVGWTGEEAGKISKQLAKTFGSTLIFGGEPSSAVDWVSNYALQEEYEYVGGNRSWNKGMSYYVKGNYKEFYITLGHILHLLEDMGVPDHTRNDTHVELIQKVSDDPGSPLEKYATRWNRDSINTLAIPQNLIASGVKVPLKNRVEDYLILAAEYSNKYFFSKDTINKYELPNVTRISNEFGFGIDENKEEFPLARVRTSITQSGLQSTFYLENEREEDILYAYFSRLARQVVLHGAGVIQLYKRSGEDEIVKREFTQYDIFRNKDIAEAVVGTFAKPQSVVFGIAFKAFDAVSKGVSAVSKGASAVANLAGNIWNVVVSPIGNVVSQIGARLSSPPAPPEEFSTSAFDFRGQSPGGGGAEDEEIIAGGGEAVSQTAAARSGEIGEKVMNSSTPTSAATPPPPSPNELARLQAQINEAARAVEALRKQAQLLAPQARLTAQNATPVFEEQEEEEEPEEGEAAPAAAPVDYDTPRSRASGVGGGGGSNAGGGSGGGSPSDTTAPGAITNLAVLSVATSSVTLSWTAPGDDGASGTAAFYTIRYATTTITEANWPSLTIFSGAPAPLAGGENQSLIITGLASGATYYFAIKSKDEAGNESGLSNIASAATDIPIPETSNVNHVVISEVQVAGVDAGDEFIELYNPTDSEIDISGWSLQYLSGLASSTALAEKKNFEPGNKIGARSYFLVARGLNASSSDGYLGARTSDMSHRTFSLSGAANGATIFLVRNQQIISGGDDPDIVDRLAYGSGAGLVAETSPAPVPPAGQSLERKAWVAGACTSAAGSNEFSGNGCDTGDNSSDFEIRSAPNPQNSLNLPETRSAPAILNLSAFYSSSTMSADFSWTLSPDARGATSTNIYTISKITSTSTVQLFRASSTESFAAPISGDTVFEFKAEDWEGLARRATVSITSPFYSYLGTIWEQDRKDITVSVHWVFFDDGTQSWAQTFIPQRDGVLNTVFVDWAPWNSFGQIADGMERCTFRLYKTNNPALANESNLLSSAIFLDGSSSGRGVNCVIGDFSSPEPGTYHFATTTIRAGESYTLIFRYREPTNPPFVWGSSSDVVPGSSWVGNVEDANKDFRLRVSGIVTSPLMFTAPPSQPQNVNINFDRFNLSLNLSWDASSDPDSGFHYQVNYTTSTAFSAEGWQTVGTSTSASIPVVYPNTYKIGVRARDDFYNVSPAAVSEWSFPAWFDPGNILAAQLDTNQVPIRAFGQDNYFKVEWGQTFTVGASGAPYSIRLSTLGVRGGSCSVKIYAVSSLLDSVPSADFQSPIATTGTLGGGSSSVCDASSSKTFQFVSTGVLNPGSNYIWIYTVEGSGDSYASNQIIGGYNPAGYPGKFSYRAIDLRNNLKYEGDVYREYNAYFELFGDLEE
jgi:hypothetical protein